MNSQSAGGCRVPSNTSIPATPTPLALRPKDAAPALGIGERKLWELTKAGAIPCVRVGRCVMYPVDELRAWLSTEARKAMV